MESFRRVLLATTELWNWSSKLLWVLFLKLRAKTIDFTLMDTLFVDTRRSWCMFFSELRSVRSLRRFPSVSREYAAVVSRTSVTQQYPYIGSCIDVWRTCTKSFSIMSFTQLRKSVYKSLCSPQLLLLITSSLQVCTLLVAMVRVWLWPHPWIKYE